MSTGPPLTDRAPSERARMADALRQLANAVHGTELTPAQLRDATATVQALTGRIGDTTTTARGPWWKRGPDFQASFDADSPFRGRENPWSPKMTVERMGPNGVGSSAVGEIMLGVRWAGPPKTVHGGVLAGLFDEIIGEAAAHADPSVFAVTGRLAVRYRTPTPIDAPLRLFAEVTTMSSRALKVHATCTANKRITSTAEALMVVRRR